MSNFEGPDLLRVRSGQIPSHSLEVTNGLYYWLSCQSRAQVHLSRSVTVYSHVASLAVGATSTVACTLRPDCENLCSYFCCKMSKLSSQIVVVLMLVGSGSRDVHAAASRCHITSPFAANTTEAYVSASLSLISEFRSRLMGRSVDAQVLARRRRMH